MFGFLVATLLSVGASQRHKCTECRRILVEPLLRYLYGLFIVAQEEIAVTHCIIQPRPPRITRVATFCSMASSHASFQFATKYVGMAEDSVRFGKILIQIDSASRHPNCLPAFPRH